MFNLFQTLGIATTTLSANYTMDRTEFIEWLDDLSTDWGIYEMFSNGNTWVLNLVMESSGWNFNKVVLTTNLYDYGNTVSFQIDFNNNYQQAQYNTLGDKRELEYKDTIQFKAFKESLNV